MPPLPKAITCRICLLALLASCGQAATTTTPERQLLTATASPDPCDNPDADVSCCFVKLPAPLSQVMAIGSPAEPGAKLVIAGTVFRADGRTPYPDVLLYAYHTDSKGYYAKSGKETGIQKWHGRLHGWCRTDARGRYEIRSIRPARYPSNTMPAHIHAALKEPGGKPSYYISDFVFRDDSLVTERYLKSIGALVGGSGIVNVTKSATGTWTGTRDITVGR